MEKQPEDRKEPVVEVTHDPVASIPTSYTSLSKTSGGVLKWWIFIPILIIGLGGLGFGLWTVSKSGLVPGKNQTEPTEIAALKVEVQKLRGEIDPLKKEILSLKEEQKAIEDRDKTLQGQVASLKEQMAGLIKRKDSREGKKQTPKVIAYKIRRGDTLSSIAKKFRVGPDDLRRWNNLPTKGRLKAGQVITIHSLTP